jgi:hypothetical protein
MEIVTWVTWFFYALLGIVVLALGLYFVVSPFALVVGLFNPAAVLDEKAPQTRIRVFLRYGITGTISVLIAFGTFVSAPAQESSTVAYSTGFVAAASAETPPVQQAEALQTPVEAAWVNVRSDRALQVLGLETIDRIAPKNEFYEPVEAQGGQLVLVALKIKNTGQESGGIAWSTYQLVDGQGRTYDQINDFSESLSIKQSLKEGGMEEPSSQLFPGQTIEVLNFFRVAPDAANFKFSANGKLVNIG